jgi:hypothetical protein
LKLDPASGGAAYTARVEQTLWHFECPMPFGCTQPYHIVSVPLREEPVGHALTVVGKSCP